MLRCVLCFKIKAPGQHRGCTVCWPKGPTLNSDAASAPFQPCDLGQITCPLFASLLPCEAGVVVMAEAVFLGGMRVNVCDTHRAVPGRR